LTPIQLSKATVEAALADPHTADLTGPMQEVFDALAAVTGGFAGQDYTAVSLTLIAPTEENA
jgi:hypothetical protein